MRYLLSFVCPPLAILLCGKPIQAIICVPLCLAYFPAVLWSLLVVSSHKADRRNRKLMKNADKNTKAQVRAMERQTRAMQEALREREQPQVIVIHAAPLQPAAQRQLPPGDRAPTSLPTVAPPAPEVRSPKPVEALDPPAPPKAPLFTVEDVRAFVAKVKRGTIVGYGNLPEWAQPITWGLAAATPVSLVAIVLFLRR